MGALRYAVLGLLNRQSMTGYEITKELDSALSEFWSAKHSQIYPELKSLDADGLVTFDTEISGNQLERKRYSITPAGKKAFLAWERSELKLKPTPKDEFRLQLFFSDCLSKDERRAMVERHLEQHRERLAHLKGNQDAFGPQDELDDAQFSDYLVLLGAVRREEATCSWLEECLQMMKGRSGEQVAPATASSSSSLDTRLL